MEKNQTLGLCMIVKNEENNIARCLESVKGIVNEIVIVDTGCTDKTIDIAKKYGARIFNYKWNNSFSEARNYAIEQATSDWLLLLDGDEELDRNDAGKLLTLINNSENFDGFDCCICSYTGAAVSNDYFVHMAFRLLRNNHKYQYAGNIHEQISSREGPLDANRFSISDIKVYHYGYLASEVKDKHKRERNIPILEGILEKTPEDAFALFNMGNEYLAMNDINKALEYYDHCYRNKELCKAYCPHLYFRIANCYDLSQQYDKAIKYLDEGLWHYPKCTDYQYVKGCILYKCKRYTLAIDSLNKCLEMSEPPPTVRFMIGCGTYKAAELLGMLYFELEDYPKAFTYYNKTLSFRHDHYASMYRAVAALNRMSDDKQKVYDRLYAYFADPDYESNAILAIDVLISEKLYDFALTDIARKNRSHEHEMDFVFLNAKVNFLKGNYDLARDLFEKIFVLSIPPKTVFPDILGQSARYLFALYAVKEPKLMPEAAKLVKKYNGDIFYRVCMQIESFINGDNAEFLTEKDDAAAVMSCIADILDKILKTKDYKIFQDALPVLNRVESKNVLLLLAKIYYDNDYTNMAISNIFRSIREVNLIDSASSKILFKEIR